MRIREILASLCHSNEGPVVQALAAGQQNIPDIWDQRWFYGVFGKVLVVRDLQTFGRLADALNASRQNEVARTCKHNLLPALQGSLEAQALQCLVEAIVGELYALSGKLRGTEGHEAPHLDAEVRAHSALHRALEELREGFASGFLIMSLSHASVPECHGINDSALLWCFLLAIKVPLSIQYWHGVGALGFACIGILAEELASLRRAAAAAEARATSDCAAKKAFAAQLAEARTVIAKVCEESSNRLKLLEGAHRDTAALRGRARTVNVWHRDHEEIMAEEMQSLTQATAAAEARAAAECAEKTSMSLQLAAAKKQNAKLERQLDVLETASQRNTMAIQALCIVVQQQAVQQIVGGQHLMRLQLELEEASRRASQQTALSEVGRQLSTTAALPPLESTGPASQTVGEELCSVPQVAEASGSAVEAPAVPKPALVNAEQEREEGCKLCDASCLGSIAPMVLQNAEASSSAVGAPALPKPALVNAEQEREEDNISPLNKLKHSPQARQKEAEEPAAAELKVVTAGASQPSSSSGEGRALKAPLTVPKPITPNKSKDSLELGSVTEAGETSPSDQAHRDGHIPAVYSSWIEPLSAPLPHPTFPSATVEEKTFAEETATPTSQLPKVGIVRAIVNAQGSVLHDVQNAATNGLPTQDSGGGRGMGQGGIMPTPGPLVGVRRHQHCLMAALPGLSGTHTGTTESDMSMATGRGHFSGGLGAPGRGGRSGGDVVEGKLGKPAPSPAPLATGLGALATVTPQHEQSGLKIGETEAGSGQQRAIAALLNQLNRENFDTILAHIIVVGSEAADHDSVSGLANQVVDKALEDPTLCEIYAELCFQLDAALPNFEPPSQGSRRRPPTTFRMQLRSKCVEEFTKGMSGVAGLQALQKPEQVKAKEPCRPQATEAPSSLRGRSLPEAQPAPCNDTQEREENRTNPRTKSPDGLDRFNKRMIAKKAGQQARRRAVANIHFMDRLFHKHLLSEKVMHSCITDLLTDIDTPEPANLECLIKLMSAVGQQLAANPLAQDYIRQYFERIAFLSTDMRLENNMRLMLQELLALRCNSWVACKAAAGGPNMSANQGNGHRTGGAPPGLGDRAPRGPSMQPNPEWVSEALSPGPSAGPSASGAVARPQPTDMKPKRNPLTMERLEGRLKSTKLGYARMDLPEEAEPGDEETAAIIRRVKEQQKKEEAVQQKEQKVLARFLKREWGHRGFEALQSRRLSREQLQDKVWGALDAFAERRDLDELRHKVEALLPLTEPSQVLVEIPMVAIRKMRGVDSSLITEVLVQLCGGAQPSLPKAAVQSGAPSLLEAVMRHAPEAADWVGGVLGGLVSAGVLSLKEVAAATLQAASREEGQNGQLVDGGSAWKLMGAVLQAVAQSSGQHQMSKQWKHTGLQLDAFFPSACTDTHGRALPQGVQAMIETYGLQSLVAKPSIGQGSATRRQAR
ncbi:hypothetical protein ABBQ38_008724 [Trebouxia sp. C0009 RCD-2024]